jgi:hypothetical protein
MTIVGGQPKTPIITAIVYALYEGFKQDVGTASILLTDCFEVIHSNQ